MPTDLKFLRRLSASLKTARECRGQLRKGNRFCVMGLACNVADPKKWENDIYDGERFFAPQDVMNRFPVGMIGELFLAFEIRHAAFLECAATVDAWLMENGDR